MREKNLSARTVFEECPERNEVLDTRDTRVEKKNKAQFSCNERASETRAALIFSLARPLVVYDYIHIHAYNPKQTVCPSILRKNSSHAPHANNFRPPPAPLLSSMARLVAR